MLSDFPEPSCCIASLSRGGGPGIRDPLPSQCCRVYRLRRLVASRRQNPFPRRDIYVRSPSDVLPIYIDEFLHLCGVVNHRVLGPAIIRNKNPWLMTNFLFPCSSIYKKNQGTRIPKSRFGCMSSVRILVPMRMMTPGTRITNPLPILVPFSHTRSNRGPPSHQNQSAEFYVL